MSNSGELVVERLKARCCEREGARPRLGSEIGLEVTETLVLERSISSCSTCRGKQQLPLGWGSFSPHRLGAEKNRRLCRARLVSLSLAAGDCRSPVKTELEEAGETALPVLRGSSNVFVFLVSIPSWISP